MQARYQMTALVLIVLLAGFTAARPHPVLAVLFIALCSLFGFLVWLERWKREGIEKMEQELKQLKERVDGLVMAVNQSGGL